MHTAPDRLTDMLTRLKLTAVRDQSTGSSTKPAGKS
jgi:hypothetical protein